jgi:hypothetical protein
MAGPTAPPTGTRFSTGEDLSLLNGPTSAPPGAVVVAPGGTGLDNATIANPAGATFYLLAGTHVLGGGSPNEFNQVQPKAGNTYIGAPGAILNGRNINRYAFTGTAAGVTLRYLEVTGFACFIDQFVVNHDAGSGWTLSYCNIHGNTGAGVGIGIGAVLSHCWLHDNSQYGFSSYKPPVDAGATSAITNVTVDHCEIAHNGTLSDEVNANGTLTGNGRNGACKFWDTNGITVTDNWVHHSNWVGIWADTNNIGCQVDGNLVEYNAAMAFMYEISYNFSITNNTFQYNAIYAGLNFASRSDNFPVPAVYISESGGDSGASSTYAASVISGNTFLNNWGDITLWESADRFCNSPANSSGKIYKPRHGGASLAVCNNPAPKVLTVSFTSGSPSFTVTSGTLESTDEGRPVSGIGIPAGTKVNEPTSATGPVGYLSPTSGQMNQNATITGSSTITLAAGTINVNPAYTACRWHTQNITISGNIFKHDSATVLNGQSLPSGVITGKIALLSQYGSYPAWSPYQGWTIADSITYSQNNVWSGNTYQGDYSWMPHDTSMAVTFAAWQATYGQDAGSTFGSFGGSAAVSDSLNAADSASRSVRLVRFTTDAVLAADTARGPSRVGLPVWTTLTGTGRVPVTLYAETASGRVPAVIGA